MAATEIYIKDTLSKDNRFVFEASGLSLIIGGALKKNIGEFNAPELSRQELLGILEDKNIPYERALAGNGCNYDFCLKLSNGQENYVRDLVAKAGYEIVTNGGATYAKKSGHT